jgi:hypothetical protein
MGRFFDVLNTPIAVLVLLGVVAGINAFLYFGYRPSEAPAPPTAVGSRRRSKVQSCGRDLGRRRVLPAPPEAPAQRGRVRPQARLQARPQAQP